ncbi:MAG: RdgB/HAM1 family non-canonical purine NTP pyrophosphatase [Saccharospirillaceae bacterium]|nr:RdgB/HAM1 family non-canonical purine NTP pyrophosphatase [Pseudomonadales bacterium]NRB78948.1 RdgB/HAM1 family non-canonical purine NTP pyrophosphatase [Saccharospirillaceae bacterium]
MSKQLLEKSWVLASGNKGKLKEFSDLLSPLNIQMIAQSEYNFEEAIEDGLSFVENAIIKARHACKHTGLPSIADDSGIEVDALNGEPGIYSARYAGENANDKDNLNLLLKNMQGKTNRAARFVCVIAFMRFELDPMPIICQATWEGTLLEAPIGEGGFGYDPIFEVNDLKKSSALLSKEEKNAISHRGQAIKLLLDRLKTMDI